MYVWYLLLQQHEGANQQQQQQQPQAEVLQAGQSKPEQPDQQQTQQQQQQQPLPTPSALGAYTQREEHLQRQEALGEILFAYVVNDNTPTNMKRCVMRAQPLDSRASCTHGAGVWQAPGCVARHRAGAAHGSCVPSLAAG